jgi:hypothetical protein
MNRRIFPLLAVVVVLGLGYSPVAAQTSGGSTYSSLNIGDLQPTTSVAGQGLAGVESAMPMPGNLNSLNPAGWADLRSVTLAAGMNFQQYQVSTASQSLYQNSTRLQGFSVGFPFSETHGITAAILFRPYSTVNYRSQLTQRIPIAGTDTALSTITKQGSGGVSQAVIGSSFKPIEQLTVGAGLDWYFGAIESRSNVEFDNSSLNPATYLTSDQYRGVGGRFGMQFRPVEGLQLGATMQTSATLNRVRLLINNSLDASGQIVDTTGTDTADLSVPQRLTVGVSYQMGRSVLGTEFSTQDWGSSAMTSATAATRYGLAYQYTASESINAEGFDRWTFRAGASYEDTYYRTPNGAISQLGFSLGVGFPLAAYNRLNANPAMDVALQFGTRGTTDNGLTREAFGKLSVELSLSELWFLKVRR